MVTTNVSLAGLQLVCPALVLGLLSRALETGEIDVTLTLPGDVAVQARCEVVYVSHYGYEYLIGARFVEFEGEGFERLREQCLDLPPTPPPPTTS
jgi:hypothetical protein